jgi:hypothetical protein
MGIAVTVIMIIGVVAGGVAVIVSIDRGGRL